MELKGRVFSIERYAIHDGEGIRTVVFLKGCPMKCLWCANPEGIYFEQKLLYTKSRCIGCDECVGTCPEGALTFKDNGLRIDRGICVACGLCVNQCYPGALVLDSCDMTISEVMDEVVKDTIFYRYSRNGGITLSGGEPLNQPVFCRELLKSCKEMSIHTTIETCGDYSWSVLQQVIPYLDMVFYDLKHIDPVVHRKITGRDNQNVIENIKKLSKSALPIVIRIPIIPGLNDSAENIYQIARFVYTLENVNNVELLPYHQLGITKYRKLGEEYRLPTLVPPEKQKMLDLQKIVQREGIACTCG